MKKTLLLIFLAISLNTFAQTFSNTTGGPIVDTSTVSFPIIVSGLPTVIDTNFGVCSVCFNINHTYISDIDVKLQSPSGTIVMLSNNNGGAGQNFTNTCLAMNGTTYLTLTTPPFTGTFIPDQSINAFNNGQDPNGTWTVLISDEVLYDQGNLINFDIVFCNNPPANPPPSTGPCSVTNPGGCVCQDTTQNNCWLLPDMRASALDIQLYHTEYPGGLTMSNATPNTGWGPMEIHGSGQCYCDTILVPCTTVLCPSGLPPTEKIRQTLYYKNGSTSITSVDTLTPGTMTYHPTHGHLHIDDWARYSLRKITSNPDATTWPIVSEGSKISFCLINLGDCSANNGYCVDSLNNTITMADIPNSPFGMVTGCGPDQGIYTGMLDIYDESLNDPIPLTGVCNGNYAIVSITDPDNNFIETNDNNNWAAVPITLAMQSSPSTFIPTFSVNFSGPTATTNNTSTPGNYFWDFGDGYTDTNYNATHTYTTSGIYTVKLYSLDNCWAMSSQNLSVWVGVSEPKPTFTGFSAFPNPSSGQLTVTYFLNEETDYSIDLYSLIGEKIYSFQNNNNNLGAHSISMNLNEASITPGSYLIRMKSNGQSSTLKLIYLK